MKDYKEMYFKMFNKITVIIEELQQIQQEAENFYINYNEPKIYIITNGDTKSE